MNCETIVIGEQDGKYVHRCRVCKTRYLSRYDEPRMFKATCRAHPKPQPPSAGPGTELTALFAELDISEKPGCNCRAIAAEMDSAGVSGCRERREYFLGKLEENAKLYSWWEKIKAGSAAWMAGAPLSLGGLFDEAVRRAGAKKYPVVVNLDRIGWGDLAIFAYIALGTRETQRPLVIGATGERARHVRLLGLEPDDPAKDKTEWTAFTAEMEHLYQGGRTGRLEFYADHYGVPRLFEKPALTIPDEHMEFAKSLGIDRRTVLFFPDSLSPNRVWPKIYWDELADLLATAGFKSLAFPIRGFEKHKNAIDAKPIIRVAACMSLAGLGIGNDSALINWTPLVDLHSLCLLGPTRRELFGHAPLIRCLAPRTPLSYNATPYHSAGADCNGCCYHFKHNPFCSQTCMSLANMLPAEVAEEAVKYHREVWG